MKYLDRFFGMVEITEPVVLELMASEPLLRLKRIDQAGLRTLWAKPEAKVGRYEYSRFNHSVGVYLLLRRYNASLEEQVAGLIHDVSHAAFSHCIDYVLPDGSEKEANYQDKIFREYVRRTKIPKILQRHGFDPDYIIDESNFPLMERALPDLCADRIEYSLRAALLFNEIGPKDSAFFLEKLGTEDDNWVFSDLESARRYAEMFLLLNKKYYAGLPSAVMFRVVGDCLAYAIEQGYIKEGDLYTDDQTVTDQIKEFIGQDQELRRLFKRMDVKVEVVNDPDNHESVVFCKSRIVDPLFRQGREIKRVSEIDEKWAGVVKEEMKPKQYFLRFID